MREWPLFDAAGMRALDRHTIETLGVPGELLMENAGRAVAELALALRRGGEPVLVVCGAGNNGGDGLVAARLLHLSGAPVRVLLLGEPASLTGDAAANHARASRAGVPFVGPDALPCASGVIVDAVFGTGLARAVTGEAAEVLRRISASRPRARVLAVDLPSGLDADTGQPLGEAVTADATLSLGLPKLGLALEPGRSLAGAVYVARIGIADAAPGVAPAATLWTDACVGARLPARPRAAHKGSFGHVLVIAGSEGKTGAAALAGEGAARAGAGLVTIACPAGLQPVLEAKSKECMTVAVADTRERSFATAAEPALLALAAARGTVVLGPGIGTDPETVALVRALVAKLERPLVVDADGLNALAGAPDVLKRRKAASILTPHPGEAGRLLGLSAADVNRDRVGAARRLAERTGRIVVLKGAATVIAAPPGGEDAGRVVVNATGGPILGTGGTGDVLAGIIGGLLAQGCAPFAAAVLGAHVHGRAGDRLARARGETGTLAGEIAAEVPRTLDALRRTAARQERGMRRDGGRRGGDLTLRFPEP
jgi:NAD(P)H-hydrate epimerase